MNVAKCQYGHYYDSDLYASCPHCISPDEREMKPVPKGRPVDNAAVEKKSFLSFLKKKRNAEISDGENESTYICEPTELMSEEELSRLLERSAAGSDKAEMRSQPDLAETEAEIQPACTVQATAADKPETCRQKYKAESEHFECPVTVGWFSAGNKNDEPCVGWLTGVSGAYRGRSFELKAGGNFIGRSPGNDIVLSDDNRVSRQRHARVAYEPRSREFYIEVGESGGLAYLNGENILHHAVLTSGDIIEIGGGSYIFVPLCSQDFSWDTHPSLNPICRGKAVMAEVSV